MSGKKNGTGIGVALLLSAGCLSREISPPASPTGSARGALSREADDPATNAQQQLATIEKEMKRIALRLQREASWDQRAQWSQEVTDIEHDRRQLREILYREQGTGRAEALDEPLHEPEVLRSTIAALYVVGVQTATKIDRALDSAPR